MWHFDQGRFRALVAGDRVLEIEQEPVGVWTVWFRRASPPYRSLRVATRLHSVEEAKTLAHDFLRQLGRAT